MYRYSLNNKNKVRCPSCGKEGKLSRYYDNKENVYLSDLYGRCDREISCGFHRVPKNEFLAEEKTSVISIPKEHNIIPKKYLAESIKRKYQDTLSKYLISVFGFKAKKTIDKYFIGCARLYNGDSTVFWQIASDGVRAGKIMQYNEQGKRMKVKDVSLTNWVHTKLYEYGTFEIEQVFFGNHLPHKDKIVVIVESEKTAIICDMFFNNSKYVFMASGMLRGLQKYKFDNLVGYKEIVLIPDFGKATNIWKEICDKLNLENVRVSESLKGLKEGEDIADAILFKKITDKTWINKI